METIITAYSDDYSFSCHTDIITHAVTTNYNVSEKEAPLFLPPNFARYWPIIKILSQPDLAVNDNKISHHPSNVSPH